jgi:hypothetical protein
MASKRKKRSVEVEAFLEEIEAVCRRHGFSISHEDGNGAFRVERFSRYLMEWLTAAIDDTKLGD